MWDSWECLLRSTRVSADIPVESSRLSCKIPFLRRGIGKACRTYVLTIKWRIGLEAPAICRAELTSLGHRGTLGAELVVDTEDSVLEYSDSLRAFEGKSSSKSFVVELESADSKSTEVE
ncbi:hypothetical protein L3X38_001620 [Prunus dulcis]|uniref:Uncharacterized protein n=1 Tax=Prunus dulcis TaxID=3755 RepID=A0AAD4WSW2_PRUDU|nr:hypothetical protein L3X38_001620 [Prunus dulcis]